LQRGELAIDGKKLERHVGAAIRDVVGEFLQRRDGALCHVDRFQLSAGA